MKTKGFTLTEMLVAMALMGLVLVGGGKLYLHLNGIMRSYQRQLEHSLLEIQSQRIFQQDLLQSIELQELTDTSICLKKHAFDPAICYVKRDSFWLRIRPEGRDTLHGKVDLVSSLSILYEVKR
jgi:prepilin-type N-terminal cleavage/methylation domain-containing protein